MNFKSIFKNIRTESLQQLEKNSVILKFKRAEKIYHQGEQPSGVYFVFKGLVGLTLISSEGKEHLLRFFRQGQFFGHRALFSKEAYHGTTIALEPTEIAYVSKPLFEEILKNDPELLFPIVEVLAKELRQSENQHVLILDHQIHVRVAQSLVYLKDLHPEHHWTRQEIANFCASTVSTVIKALADLEERGYIAQNGRTIDLLDKEALVRMQDVFE